MDTRRNKRKKHKLHKDLKRFSVLLAGFTLMAAFIFHYQPAEQMQMLMFMKNVSVAGGFLALAAAGAGAFSLDARLGKHW